MSCILIDLGMRFETAESCDMGCATLLEGRFFDAPKSISQVTKIRIWEAIFRLAISQKSCFWGAKLSNRSSTILHDVRFAEVQEFRFQGEKRSNMGSAVQQ